MIHLMLAFATVLLTAGTFLTTGTTSWGLWAASWFGAVATVMSFPFASLLANVRLRRQRRELENGRPE